MQPPRPQSLAHNGSTRPVSVGVVAPLGRDGELIAARLRGAGLKAQEYADVDGLCGALEDGHLGVLLLTSEALGGASVSRLRELLRGQPAWSDIPALVLRAPGRRAGREVRLLSPIGPRPSATVLERPVSTAVLVAVTHLAVLARERQLDVRDALLELEHANARLEARVESRTREVRRLASDLTLAEQAERRRVADLLHDDLQQRLYGLSITLDLLGDAAKSPDPGRAQHLLRRARVTLDGTVSLTRKLSHGLAPPLLKGEGVEELIGWVAARAEDEYGLRVDVEVADGLSVTQEAIRIVLGQILGEFLFNAAKHSETDRVRVAAVAASDPSMIRVVVEDEGAGFDPSQSGGGFGLTSSRERAELIGGRVMVESVPGEGTRSIVEVPAGESEGSIVSAGSDAAVLGGDGAGEAKHVPTLRNGPA